MNLKWNVAEAVLPDPDDFFSPLRDLAAIEQILEPGRLTTHFQPIFSSRDGSIFGHECLLRTVGENPFGGIDSLFRVAHEVGAVSALDVKSLETLLVTLTARGNPFDGQALFVNICPETLMNPDITLRQSEELVNRLGIGKDRVVLELTEESFISNYDLFRRSLAAFRRKGYRIAIDDFGAGYCGLKMLSAIEPDFVKIDRHFISRIDRTLVKYNLVDAIATACHRIGITVIAEGIERQEELDVIRGFGIDLLQGYLLGRPAADMAAKPAERVLVRQVKPAPEEQNSSHVFIGSISEEVPPIAPDVSVGEVLDRFLAQSDLAALPVVADGQVAGIVNRRRFIEEQVVGKHGYAYSINYYKTIGDLMEEVKYEFEATATFEEVSAAIQAAGSRTDYCNICVTRNGRYFGVVNVGRLLDAISDMNVMLAKGCNPLSGLPGNDFIQREIDRRLVQNMHFDVAYIDIDNFKPFNDHYGFEKGDFVLRTLAEIVAETVSSGGSGSFDFAGHIGGDDFIVITRPRHSVRLARQVVEKFRSRLREFHGCSDFMAGKFLSFNRKGEREEFPLLSLSIGIVGTENVKFTSYGELASLATEVKGGAKLRAGFSILRDRRRHSR